MWTWPIRTIGQTESNNQTRGKKWCQQTNVPFSPWNGPGQGSSGSVQIWEEGCLTVVLSPEEKAPDCLCTHGWGGGSEGKDWEWKSTDREVKKLPQWKPPYWASEWRGLGWECRHAGEQDWPQGPAGLNSLQKTAMQWPCTKSAVGRTPPSPTPCDLSGKIFVIT